MPYRPIAAVISAAAAMAVSPLIHAQAYPTKPVRIVTMEAGGGNDTLARLLARGITPGLGQNVIVDNRGGGSGIVSVQAVTKAPPDGYTLLSSSAAVWVLPLMQSVPYEVRELAPISLTASSPGVFLVNPDVPAKTVRELIAYAKSRPGVLNYGVAGAASVGNFSAELFRTMSGVDITRVAYKNGSPLNDLIAGRLQMSFSVVASVITPVKSGKLRALAVTSAKPTELMPGVPPVTSEGLPGYEMSAAYGLFAPAATPPAIVAHVNQVTVQALRAPELKDQFFKFGADIVASSPQEFTAYIGADQAKLAKLIKEAGITADQD